MTGYLVDELPIPDRQDGAAYRDFCDGVDARNATEIAGYGTAEVVYPADELFGFWQDPHEPKRWWGARVDGRIVARAVLEWQQDDDQRVAWVKVEVHPDHAGRGIGRDLYDVIESTARAEGFRRMLTYVVSPDGPGDRLTPPTGAGSVPAGNPEVRFLLHRGWRLEQVTRASRFALPADVADLQRRRDEAAANAGADYRVHVWRGPTPAEWIDDLAVLHTRMSTEEPTAGMEQPEDPWDAQRVIDHDARAAESPRETLTAAAEHVPTGRLAAFTQVNVPADATRPVSQDDTLVLREHRGHRLGMLLKVENLLQLELVHPGRPSVLTWNAEENRAMLDVNEAVGFVPIGYEGAWRKDL